MTHRPRYPFNGPEALRGPIEHALRRVVDPEIAMNIVDLGLVHAIVVTDDRLHVTMTMTSAACPVVDAIVDDIEHVLDRVAPPGLTIAVEVVWQPPWSHADMSMQAKRQMGWRDD